MRIAPCIYFNNKQPTDIKMNEEKNEKYLTIKELSYELDKLGLPHSRQFINKIRARANFVANRGRLSEVLKVLKCVNPRESVSNADNK